MTKPGDKIKLDAYVQFVEEADEGLVAGMLGFLASTYGASSTPGGETFDLYTGLTDALTSLASFLTNDPNSPKAPQLGVE